MSDDQTPRTTINILARTVPRLLRIAGAMQMREGKQVTVTDVVNKIFEKQLSRIEAELGIAPPEDNQDN